MNTIFLAFLFPFLAASTETPAPVAKLECTVRVVADEIKEGFGEAKFITDVVSQETHGGEQRKFTFAPYEVSTLADGKWIGLSWWRGDDLIAEAVFVITNASTESRVAILYDPKDRNKMVSLDCNAAAQAAPDLKPQRF